ncbi:ribosomal protein L6, alpha-beta domain-containing protein [Cladochytrium replicatum]|nr:ribosomal protein L6, alpha-beta domain-containing protein [Cladochytrium replicatum]
MLTVRSVLDQGGLAQLLLKRVFASPSCNIANPRTFLSTPPTHSMIGRRPIKYSPDVSISIAPRVPDSSFPTCENQVVVTGPLGTLSMPLHSFVQVSINASAPGASSASGMNVVKLSVDDPEHRRQKAIWGTSRALLNRMVEGVTEGVTVPLRFVGVGYRAQLDEAQKRIELRLGYSHSIFMKIPEGIEVVIPQPQRILLKGIDLPKITQFAAQIRKWRPPEPYNQKGIFVGDETIKKKEGKRR